MKNSRANQPIEHLIGTEDPTNCPKCGARTDLVSIVETHPSGMTKVAHEKCLDCGQNYHVHCDDDDEKAVSESCDYPDPRMPLNIWKAAFDQDMLRRFGMDSEECVDEVELGGLHEKFPFDPAEAVAHFALKVDLRVGVDDEIAYSMTRA